MKKHYLQFGALLLATSLTVVSCVETEELDSVKAMREAKADNMNAQTALVNNQALLAAAQLASQRIQNSYDSVSNSYQLLVEKANADYQVALANNSETVAAERLKTDLANAAYQLSVANSNLAVQAEQAKSSLYQAQSDALYFQMQFTQAQAKQQLEANNNPFKLGLLRDYSVYYNGGTLSDDETYIADGGIFGLKADIADENENILDYTRYKANSVYNNQTEIDYLTAKKVAIGTYIAEQNRVLQIGLDAKSTQDNSAAYNSLKTLAADALTAYDAKKALAVIAENKRDTAETSYYNAQNLYYSNYQVMNDADDICDDILWDYGVDAVAGLQTQLNEANVSLANANTTLSDATKEVAIWKAKYDIVYPKLTTDNAVKDAAYLALQAAIYQVDTADVTPPMASQTLKDAVTAKQTIYDDAETKYNATVAEYNSVNSNYQSALNYLSNAQSNLNYASENVNDITLAISTYNLNYPIYTAALAKDASLYAQYIAKRDQYDVLDREYNVAYDNLSNAYNFYQSAVSARDNMASTIDDMASNNESIDRLIADTNQSIADYNAEIVSIDAEIAAYTNVKSQAGYDNMIAEAQERITSKTKVIALLEAKAAAIFAQIGSL